ncbi:hypothetical protein D3C71_1331950 [compost metagenome]
MILPDRLHCTSEARSRHILGGEGLRHLDPFELLLRGFRHGGQRVLHLARAFPDAGAEPDNQNRNRQQRNQTDEDKQRRNSAYAHHYDYGDQQYRGVCHLVESIGDGFSYSRNVIHKIAQQLPRPAPGIEGFA